MPYRIYKRDQFGNQVPYLVTNTEEVTTELMRIIKGLQSLYIPKNVQTLIKM